MSHSNMHVVLVEAAIQTPMKVILNSPIAALFSPNSSFLISIFTAHAEQGKFDMIVTKSVSRFARNLIDCITWVRALQDHDPPIAVYFEQEGINTLNTSSNIILFVLAMVAEEESHMKSEAMLLSLEWRFSRGRFLLPSILGYDKIIDRDETGTIIRRRMRVNEDEARTVRLMYYMLVNGASLTTIADTLTELKRETGWHKISSKFSNTEWTPGAVRNVLRKLRVVDLIQ